MQLIAKIYDIGGSIKTQIISPQNLNFTKELLDIGEMNFDVQINSQDATEIQEWRPVRLFIRDDNNPTGTLFWSGYITTFTYRGDRVFVNCSEEKILLQKKISTINNNFSSAGVDSVLSTITSEINGRSSGIEPSITYTTDLTDTITRSFESGTSIYEIIQDIAQSIGAEWKLEDNKITLSSTIGEDKTSGANFVELISTVDSPSQNNVANLEIKANAVENSTYVFGKNSTTTDTQSDLTTAYGVKEVAQSFNDGDLTAQTTEYLNSHKVPRREISVEPTAIYTNLTTVNVGDTIRLRVERNTPLIDGQFDLKVIRSRFEYINAMPILRYDLADGKQDIKNAKNFFSEISRRLKLQELK